jgi:hypothetical protein
VYVCVCLVIAGGMMCVTLIIPCCKLVKRGRSIKNRTGGAGSNVGGSRTYPPVCVVCMCVCQCVGACVLLTGAQSTPDNGGRADQVKYLLYGSGLPFWLTNLADQAKGWQHEKALGWGCVHSTTPVVALIVLHRFMHSPEGHQLHACSTCRDVLHLQKSDGHQLL